MIFTTIVMNIALALTPSANDTSQAHIARIFGPLQNTVASLAAYIVSSSVDIYLYQLIRKFKPDFTSIWLRNNLSTLISQIVDNLIFVLLRF